MPKEDISTEVEFIIKAQNELERQEQEIYAANPKIFEQIKEIEEAKLNVDKLWDALKDRLASEGDYDAHEITVGNYTCRYTLSKTVKIGVENIDAVPEEFVEEKKVADESKLKKYYELYGELPKGCVDKSYNRLIKKISSKGIK